MSLFHHKRFLGIFELKENYILLDRKIIKSSVYTQIKEEI